MSVEDQNAQPTVEPTQAELQAAWDAEIQSRLDPTQVASDSGEQTGQTTGEPEKKPEPTVEERLAAAEADKLALQQKLNRESGRTSALQKQLDAAKAATQAAVAKGQDAPSASQAAAAAEDPAEWKQLMADFPEWATAVQKKLDAALAAAKPAAAPGVDASQIDSIVEQKLANKEIARIDQRHPDWRATVNTQDFKTWQASQPAHVQALADSDYSGDAIELLDKFKASKTKSPAEVAAELQARRKTNLNLAATNGQQGQHVPANQQTAVDAKSAWDAEVAAREARRKQRAA